MNNTPANRQEYSPLGFANLENVPINNHLLQPLENQFNRKTSTINSTLSPLLNQLSLKNTHSPQQISSRESSSMNQPYVRIVEQPARCALRFRYECEGRSAGSIPGCNSTSDNKTYPTIELVNYEGQAVVVVSCVTAQSPYKPHPHNLVGKDFCKKGICTQRISENQRCTFTSLGIQCVKKKDIEESLRVRESINVDPFRTGFAHRSHSAIDLNVVRLCFQVFIQGDEKDRFTVPLTPVVSDPIYDKKAMSDLNITRLSHCSASIAGGQEMILLCDRITKDDIQVKFYEEQNGQIIWEANADFQPNDVHKQVAIVFRVPKYYQEYINQPVTVYIQLRRPSDNHLSEARPFQYTPNSLDQCSPIVRKRQKFDENLDLENDKRSFDLDIQHQQMTNEFRVPRILSNPMRIDTEQTISNTLQTQSFFNIQQASANSPIQKNNSPDNQFNENSKFIPENTMVHNFVKNENGLTFGTTFNHGSSSSNTNRFDFGQIKEEPMNQVKTESFELDIDANDLISDINFNNMMVMINSDNNVTFNSSGNIKMEQDSISVMNNDQQTPNSLLDIIQNNQINF